MVLNQPGRARQAILIGQHWLKYLPYQLIALVVCVRFLVLLFCFLSWPLLASNSLNVLVYHHVSSDTPPSTSVTPEQFRQHLQALADGPFQVVDLGWAIEQLQQGQPLPDYAVAITFDDGYKDIHTNGLPLLVEFGMPFTLFVSTEAADRQFGDKMDWDQLRDLQAQGATIANHSVSHDYFVRQPPLDDAWLAAAYADIQQAQQRLEAELGPTPKWFAYPYGEYNNALRDKLEAEGWIAFGQQSGGIGPFSDFQALPRFPASGLYANWATLETKLRSLPMPVNYQNLPDPLVVNNPPLLTLDLLAPVPASQTMNCFVNGEWVDSQRTQNNQINLQALKALPQGRSRYNCTYKGSDGRFYWFSHQWLLP